MLRDRVFVGTSLRCLKWAVSCGAIYTFLPLFGQERGILNVRTFFTIFVVTNLIGRVLVLSFLCTWEMAS
jgi:uncharacterized membrane protein YbhN (UPF0104 family)